jgi:hypothetical protein
MRFSVIPAKAGIQENKHFWTPAFAGVTALVTSCEAVNFVHFILFRASPAFVEAATRRQVLRISSLFAFILL